MNFKRKLIYLGCAALIYGGLCCGSVSADNKNPVLVKKDDLVVAGNNLGSKKNSLLTNNVFDGGFEKVDKSGGEIVSDGREEYDLGSKKNNVKTALFRKNNVKAVSEEGSDLKEVDSNESKKVKVEEKVEADEKVSDAGAKKDVDLGLKKDEVVSEEGSDLKEVDSDKLKKVEVEEKVESDEKVSDADFKEDVDFESKKDEAVSEEGSDLKEVDSDKSKKVEVEEKVESDEKVSDVDAKENVDSKLKDEAVIASLEEGSLLKDKDYESGLKQVVINGWTQAAEKAYKNFDEKSPQKVKDSHIVFDRKYLKNFIDEEGLCGYDDFCFWKVSLCLAEKNFCSSNYAEKTDEIKIIDKEIEEAFNKFLLKTYGGSFELCELCNNGLLRELLEQMFPDFTDAKHNEICFEAFKGMNGRRIFNLDVDCNFGPSFSKDFIELLSKKFGMSVGEFCSKLGKVKEDCIRDDITRVWKIGLDCHADLEMPDEASESLGFFVDENGKFDDFLNCIKRISEAIEKEIKENYGGSEEFYGLCTDSVLALFLKEVDGKRFGKLKNRKEFLRNCFELIKEQKTSIYKESDYDGNLFDFVSETPSDDFMKVLASQLGFSVDDVKEKYNSARGLYENMFESSVNALLDDLRNGFDKLKNYVGELS